MFNQNLQQQMGPPPNMPPPNSMFNNMGMNSQEMPNVMPMAAPMQGFQGGGLPGNSFPGGGLPGGGFPGGGDMMPNSMQINAMNMLKSQG